MSIQLFLSLVKYFNKQFSTTAPANGADAKDITGIFNVTTALQLLELELPNLLYIFELLASSAAAHHSVDGVVITSRDQFTDQLRLINITLTGTYSLTYSLTYLLTQSPTHSPTYRRKSIKIIHIF